ncbi:MAG: metallophosphoesterase, partial [Gloeobacteraceae cyanobacterium ES-bin-144]|nr:metallophosphoesterase [Verrucomicrobiales bacterium]
APITGSSVVIGTAIPISATATDSDGTISKVEFFAGTTKLGEDTTGPDYSYNWTGATAGTYSLTAVATDDLGGSSTSAAVSVTVIPGPSGTLTRSPYLNSPGHNSIVVRWRSSSSVVGRVRYGTSPTALTQFTDESTARTAHEVKLTGLTPYTRYYYSVGSALDTLTPETIETTSFSPGAPAPTAADYTFRTSPTPGTAANTRIWIIGDCGRGSQVQADGRNAYYTSNFTGGYTGTRIPDLNLQMGDNAYNSGTDTEYQSGYFNMYANIFRKMPQMSTLGNHDANNTTPGVDGTYSYPYFDMFTFPTAGELGGVASGTEHYYSFDYGNIHFVCLDSNSSTRTVDNPATTGVNEDAPMAAWLRQDLASTTATWIIAFWHHPPYSKGSHDSDTEPAMVQMRERFNPILENGGVDLVFNGHSHNYERSVLLDGNYGTTGTITAAMKKNSGNGSTTGITTVTNGKVRNAANNFTATATTATTIPADGAYIKPLTGPRDRFGAVYNTAGMSGLADTGAINHSAMYISYNNVGTVNLDVNGNSLTCTFVQSGGATPDNFTITKQGAADTDADGISDAFEIANNLNRYGSDAATGTDSDGLSNFLEFAFGLNPNVNDAGVVEADIPNGLLTKRGSPTNWFQATPNGTDFRVLFIRRRDYLNEGLNYMPQFSGDMITWTTSTVTPTVIATDGDVELVTIRYPFFVAGKKARFFRVAVD